MGWQKIEHYIKPMLTTASQPGEQRLSKSSTEAAAYNRRYGEGDLN